MPTYNLISIDNEFGDENGNINLTKFSKNVLEIEPFAGIIYNIDLEKWKHLTNFTNNNPISLVVPKNDVVEIPIGTTKRFSVQGNGTVTIGVGSATGIIFITKSMEFKTGESFSLTKIDTNTWIISGGGGSGGGESVSQVENIPYDVTTWTQTDKAGSMLQTSIYIGDIKSALDTINGQIV